MNMSRLKPNADLSMLVSMQWFLNNWNVICDRTKLAEFYRNMACKKGFTKSTKDFGISQINEEVNDTIPSRTLEMLLKTSNGSHRNKRWIYGITSYGAELLCSTW
jgi:hypothetical protein